MGRAQFAIATVGIAVLTCALASFATVQTQSSSSASTASTASTAKKATSSSHKRKPVHPSTAARKGTATTHPSTSSQTKPASASHRTSSGKRSSKGSLKRTKSGRVRGQQKIDSERARSIQDALIREHYLTGDASGEWNQDSEDAMRRYQSDHGWQTKEVPDSRALINLGLGPSHDHLLNPESAMTTAPATSHSAAPQSNGPAPASQGAIPDAAPQSTPVQGSSPNSH